MILRLQLHIPDDDNVIVGLFHPGDFPLQFRTTGCGMGVC
jgi:hypothetical protein